MSVYFHHQHAHCESGSAVNLLRYKGLEVSEPMVFGIGSGLFFGHIPFIKVGGAPGTVFRAMPGSIFSHTARRLNLKMHRQRFRRPDQATDALNRALDQGKAVGLQASVFYLPYLPEAYRFHFNAHSLVVYGRQGGDYLVSDPVLEQATKISVQDLEKARFAKGMLAPKGYMFTLESIPETLDFHKAILKGIRFTCFLMLAPLVPFFGVKGIEFLSTRLESYPRKLSERKASHYLGNIIRMQEVVGTGGGGFRYLQAAFFQEAAALLGDQALHDFSGEMTSIGDHWREFASEAARVMNFRPGEPEAYAELSVYLKEIAAEEKSLFLRLRKWARAR